MSSSSWTKKTRSPTQPYTLGLMNKAAECSASSVNKCRLVLKCLQLQAKCEHEHIKLWQPAYHTLNLQYTLPFNFLPAASHRSRLPAGSKSSFPVDKILSESSISSSSVYRWRFTFGLHRMHLHNVHRLHHHCRSCRYLFNNPLSYNNYRENQSQNTAQELEHSPQTSECSQTVLAWHMKHTRNTAHIPCRLKIPPNCVQSTQWKSTQDKLALWLRVSQHDYDDYYFCRPANIAKYEIVRFWSKNSKK